MVALALYAIMGAVSDEANSRSSVKKLIYIGLFFDRLYFSLVSIRCFR